MFRSSLRSLIMFLFLLSIIGTVDAADLRGTARFDPELESLLLEHGYTRNIMQAGGAQVLRASQRNYTTATWSRDLDYAITGYSYVLHDMDVLRENLELFLDATTEQGVAPEFYDVVERKGVNRDAWDSMPNVIHASYVYVAKTGDTAWTRRYIPTLERIIGWIERLDTNGDALPDRDIFPYGYNDATRNSVMHTYALAKFYAAYREMAALTRMVGRDDQRYEQMAAKLRANFHASTGPGGYWPDNQNWPIAWRNANGKVVSVLETFSVFQACYDGLIGPQDGWRYRRLMDTVHDALGALIGGPTPTKYTLGGYPERVRREFLTPAFNWVLDAASPWIVGLHGPAVAQAGYPEDARAVLDSYVRMARNTDPPVLEGAVGPEGRYGAGNSDDRGRTWDNAAWFMAVYGGHYGLRMTPEALIVAPRPLKEIAGDGVDQVAYQGSQVSLQLDAANRVYRLSTDRPINVILHPVGDSATIKVNGIERGQSFAMRLDPGEPAYVESYGYTTQRSDFAFERVWTRADASVHRGNVSRSWLWGPQPLHTTREAYADSPNGSRLVEYYDKARMEITRPGNDRNNRYFVTNGLLVKELVSGNRQVGDEQFESQLPADNAVAGDPGPENTAPPYKAFAPHASLNLDNRAQRRIGAVVTATIDQGGRVGDDPTLGRPETRIVAYDATLGHNIPDVTDRFLRSQPDDPLYVFGYPITEPYWTTARVGGVSKAVLVQLFERRTVTYTPSNPAAFRVEMGNVGQHYHQWRYGYQPWDNFEQRY